MNCWLMKSEPDVFSIDDLQRKTIEPWNGVRNYQARNFIRQMKIGDLAYFYHSNADVIGIAGLMEIHCLAYPDPTQFDPKTESYDPKSTRENPRWSLVDVKFKKKFLKILTLEEMKKHPPLKDLILLRKGNRLSVMPLSLEHHHVILSLIE